ncbi:hypothetical protein SLEP1_g33829 [Rubroshorea leprosula]|uniref:Uncharacterized protein n=1 Tax=Rubroshorea leprosula TaxID=152421 RepID=A0AAV5KHX9_9ROSI|nr:hypothetical protein SLEP1_g33829 [Rubroshorea leprosula]
MLFLSESEEQKFEVAGVLWRMKIADYLSSNSPPLWATLIAGVFLVITLSLSMYLLFEHLNAYKNPEEQKFLIGVIVMVPCYAVESVSCFILVFALRFSVVEYIAVMHVCQ